MRVWTAHARDERSPELVREGFSWGATFFGPLWLLAHSAWIPAALVFAAWLLLATLSHPSSGPFLGWLLAFATGFFANDARRWSLSLAGYGLAGVIAARDEDAAFVRLVAARPELISDAAGLRT